MSHARTVSSTSKKLLWTTAEIYVRLVMEEPERQEGNEELFDLMDKLPHRISGFLMDGGNFTYDSANKVWIIQKKEAGRLIKLNVPHGCDGFIKRIKELMVDVHAADLEHMIEIRKKVREPRQPILAEEVDQSAWSVRVSFMLGQALHLKALQHINLTSEELKDANLALPKFLGYYEKLRSQDVNRLTPDQAEKRRRMQTEADRSAKVSGYTVVERTSIPFVLIEYECPGAPQTPKPFSNGLESVLILKSRWNSKTEDEAIRRDIALRLNSLY